MRHILLIFVGTLGVPAIAFAQGVHQGPTAGETTLLALIMGSIVALAYAISIGEPHS